LVVSPDVSRVPLALAAASQARSELRIGRPSKAGFATVKERETVFAAQAAEFLCPLLPACARRGLLGNLENFDFIGEPEQRCMLKDAVLVKSGARGD